MNGDLGPEAERRILAERARLLARPVSDALGHAGVELLTLTLGGERWGLEARLVWEVFRISELAHLPGAEAPVTGIAPWRGLILPMLDLRSVLGIPSAPLDDLRFAAVVGSDRPVFGILADAVDEVGAAAEGDLREPPEGVALHPGHLLSVTAAALPVLDCARIIERYG